MVTGIIYFNFERAKSKCFGILFESSLSLEEVFSAKEDFFYTQTLNYAYFFTSYYFYIKVLNIFCDLFYSQYIFGYLTSYFF